MSHCVNCEPRYVREAFGDREYIAMARLRYRHTSENPFLYADMESVGEGPCSLAKTIDMSDAFG
ncbi:MAG: hypothetical protein SV775_05315 [Thermodesulfobacteriota bacterium]|nr:hypothetical protein [Thermodesulfobacteriota bacterium]